MYRELASLLDDILNRSMTGRPPTVTLPGVEIALLAARVNVRTAMRRRPLGHYLVKFAWLGRYLSRADNLRSSNTVMWRGLPRPPDIALRAALPWRLWATEWAK
jgi:hypothetical protein